MSTMLCNEQEFKCWSDGSKCKDGYKRFNLTKKLVEPKNRNALFSAQFESAKQRGELGRSLLYVIQHIEEDPDCLKSDTVRKAMGYHYDFISDKYHRIKDKLKK